MEYDKDCEICGTIPERLSLQSEGPYDEADPKPPAWEKLTTVDASDYLYAEQSTYRHCPECGAWFIACSAGSDHYMHAGNMVITRVPAPDSDEARERAEALEARLKPTRWHNSVDAKRQLGSLRRTAGFLRQAAKNSRNLKKSRAATKIKKAKKSAGPRKKTAAQKIKKSKTPTKSKTRKK